MGLTTRKPVKGLYGQACVKLKDFSMTSKGLLWFSMIMKKYNLRIRILFEKF